MAERYLEVERNLRCPLDDTYHRCPRNSWYIHQSVVTGHFQVYVCMFLYMSKNFISEASRIATTAGCLMILFTEIA